eukprot:PhF_6_TR22746/c0_g1_i1/m.32425
MGGNAFSACGGPSAPHVSEEEIADSIFAAFWEPFINNKYPTEISRPLGCTWQHIAAKAWAQRKCEGIRQEMEERGLATKYDYVLKGSKKDGFVTLRCTVDNGPKFVLEITYPTG